MTAWLRALVGNDHDRKLAWGWATAMARGAYIEFCRERRIDPAKTADRIDRIAPGIGA